MNKFLRYSFVALMAMLIGKASAQEVTLDFTLATGDDGKTSEWGFPAGSSNKTVEEKSFTYGNYTIKLAGSEGNGYYWHDKDHYLLFGKQGATLTLPAFDFDVERIDIEGTSGASTGIKQNIFVGDEAVSTETTGAKDVTNQFVIAEGKQAAGTIYTIKVTSNHNNQIKTIKIWKKGTVSGGDEPATPAKEMSVADALAYTIALGADVESTEDITVKGKICSIKYTYSANYGTATYNISDDGQTGEGKEFTVYGSYYFDNKKWEEGQTQIAVGDEVIVKGKVIYYQGNTPEFSNKKNYLISLNGKTKDESTTPPTPDTPTEVNVAKALEIINALEDGKTTSEEYLVKGFVVGTPDFQRKADGTLYGNVNFAIADEKGGATTLTVFRAKDFENASFTEETINRIKEGDGVVVRGKLQKYVKNDVMTPELTSCYLISVTPAAIEGAKVWDFTKWSDATVANLKADAAASKTSGWSDVEKKADAEAGADPTEASKDNCFWLQLEAAPADGALTANGVVIEELKGLKFDAEYAAKRSLAIAVNYPSTSLGDYAGPAYLWLGGGGSKQSCPCFTIPGVKAGSKITFEMESHKPSDARGVGLYKNSYEEANLIGEQFKPTAKATNTWDITEDCDVVVWNTSGCHIYKIEVTSGAAGIQAVKTVKSGNGFIYNLAGQRVDANYKGVVIKNGQKMIQK
jgi:hypothetical protein